MNRLVLRLTYVPYILTRIRLLQHLQNLPVPELRITTVRFRLYVVPPHILLALRKGPGGFVSHGTRLTGDTPVRVKYERKLLFRMFLLIDICSLPAQLPVIDFRLYRNLLSLLC